MIGAAIDLGSNSFICLVFKKDPHGQMQVLHDEVVLTRLSEAVDQNKRLSKDALKRSEEAFKKFHSYFKKYNVEKVLAVATSAARDAQNQKEFLDIAAKYDIPIKILSGNQEAQMTFLGIKEYFNDKTGVVIDIGGGSTEYILVSNGEMVQRVSLDMGVVRFSERFDAFDDYKSKKEKIHKAIQELIVGNEVLQDMRKNKIDLILAVSGTPTNAAALMVGGFDSEQIEGFKLTQNHLHELEEKFSFLNLDARLKQYPFIDPKRSDVLPVGLAILDESMKFFEIPTLSISTKGIRHGAAKILLGSNHTFF